MHALVGGGVGRRSNIHMNRERYTQQEGGDWEALDQAEGRAGFLRSSDADDLKNKLELLRQRERRGWCCRQRV